MIQRDQQINDIKEKSYQGKNMIFKDLLMLIIDISPRSSYDSSTKIRIQLKYDNEKLFVMVRHANNLVTRIIFLMSFYIFNRCISLAIEKW
jgi:hypothetical protein